MEKINCLQRRVVFLESELADAARSVSASDDEDPNSTHYQQHERDNTNKFSKKSLGKIERMRENKK